MSITAEYFFNADLSLPELAEGINRALGCSLAPEGSGPDLIYSCGFFGADFVLYDNHGYEDDGELNFENFRFYLGNKTWSGPMRASPIQVEVIAEAAFLLHRRLGIHAGMLTFDLQTLLARYDLIGGEWFDTVSGKRVGYPAHLVDLKARIHNPAGKSLIY